VKLTVLYFAAVRDLVGTSEEALVVPDDVTSIGALAGHLASRYPALGERLSAVRFARNETFVTADEPVASGDVIAVIPPVAGG